MLYVLLLLIAATSVSHIEACSCLQSHLQSLYCDADFVMQVRLRGPPEEIYRKEETEDFDETSNSYRTFINRRVTAIKYNVKIRQIYKLKDNSTGLDKNSTVTEIFTGPNDGLCGVRLFERTNYLLSGKYYNGALHIDICSSIASPWSFITKMQKKGLRFTYKRSCDCNIQNINYVDEVDPKACVWDPRKVDGNCYERQTACILDKNSSTGGCKWQRNGKLKACRLDAKSRRKLP